MKILKKRITLLDEIRGFIFFLMAVYHALFDLEYIFGIHIFIFEYGIYKYIALFIGMSYIFISGFSSNLSHNIYKRGVLCFLAAMVITLITHIITPKLTIFFGVLHFLAIAMICSPFIKKFTDKINSTIVIILCVICFIMTYNLQMGYLGIKPYFYFPLPLTLRNTGFLFPFGICSERFFSGDFYPIFPWIFVYTLGIAAGKNLNFDELPSICYKKHGNILSFCGKHSLLLYLIHQVVIVIALWLVFTVI